MKYIIKLKKDNPVKYIKTKAEKEGLKCSVEGNNIVIESVTSEDGKSQVPIPVMFKGKIKTEEETVIVTGRINYGFYLSSLLAFSAVLISARLTASLIQKQKENMILCGIVTVLLILVATVTEIKGKPLKNKIKIFLENL